MKTETMDYLRAAHILETNFLFQGLYLPVLIDILETGTVLDGPLEEKEVAPDSLVVCLEGRIRVHQAIVDPPLLDHRYELDPGERSVLVACYDRHVRSLRVTMGKKSLCLVLTRAHLDTLVCRYSILGYKICLRLARRLKTLNEGIGDFNELAGRSRGWWRRRLSEVKYEDLYRRVGKTFFARWVKEIYGTVFQYKENPIFWMLLSFSITVAICRLVVAAIVNFDLESRMYNLIPDAAGQSIHIHHFNYGLLLMLVSAAAFLSPKLHRWLLLNAAVFGVGLGLFMDELGLVLKLDPNYFVIESKIAIGITAILLFAGIHVFQKMRPKHLL